jgi:hypothetical protein
MSIGIKKGKDVNWAGLAFGLDILYFVACPEITSQEGISFACGLRLAAGAKL